MPRVARRVGVVRWRGRRGEGRRTDRFARSHRALAKAARRGNGRSAQGRAHQRRTKAARPAHRLCGRGRRARCVGRARRTLATRSAGGHTSGPRSRDIGVRRTAQSIRKQPKPESRYGKVSTSEPRAVRSVCRLSRRYARVSLMDRKRSSPMHRSPTGVSISRRAGSRSRSIRNREGRRSPCRPTPGR